MSDGNSSRKAAIAPKASSGGGKAGGPASTEYDVLEGRLGYTLERALLVRALTHRSYAYENGGLPTNERLEFLGDSVLGLVVTDTLYRVHPDVPEGTLAKLRAAVVNSARSRTSAGAWSSGRSSASARVRRAPAAATSRRSSPTPSRP